MTSTTWYNNIPCECPACGAKLRDVHVHIRWANKHGACIRVFCDACDKWTDRKRADKTGLVDRDVPHSIPLATYVERHWEDKRDVN